MTKLGDDRKEKGGIFCKRAREGKDARRIGSSKKPGSWKVMRLGKGGRERGIKRKSGWCTGKKRVPGCLSQ
jgi:hypothetical protein